MKESRNTKHENIYQHETPEIHFRCGIIHLHQVGHKGKAYILDQNSF